jgi:hypothetical protein
MTIINMSVPQMLGFAALVAKAAELLPQYKTLRKKC